MERFSANAFGLAKVGLEKMSLWEALNGFCSQPHAQAHGLLEHHSSWAGVESFIFFPNSPFLPHLPFHGPF